MKAKNETQKNQDGAPSKRGKNDQIVAGCRSLAARQKPGQCFTPSEIGRACGVSDRAITFIERKAMYNFAKRFHGLDGKTLTELFQNRPMTEVFGDLKKNTGNTGRPAKRIAQVKKKTPKPSVPMMAVVRELETRAADRNWRSEKSRKGRNDEIYATMREEREQAQVRRLLGTKPDAQVEAESILAGGSVRAA